MKFIYFIAICLGFTNCSNSRVGEHNYEHALPRFQVSANLNFMEPVFPYNDTILVKWTEIEKKFSQNQKLDLLKRVEDVVAKEFQDPRRYHKDEIPNLTDFIHVLDLNSDGIDDFIYDGVYGPEDEIQLFIQKNGRFYREAQYYLQRDDGFDGIVHLEFDDLIGLKMIYYRDANQYGPSSGLTFADYFFEVRFTGKDKSHSFIKSYTRVNCTELPSDIALNKKIFPRLDSIPIYFSTSREICEGVQAKDSIIGYFSSGSKARAISAKIEAVGQNWYCGEFELKFPMFGNQTLLGWVKANEVKPD